MPSSLRSSKLYPKELTGRVVSINGGYINVVPDGCWWLSEFYAAELKLIEPWPRSKRKLKKFCEKYLEFYTWRMAQKGLLIQ